jgi:TolB-like protein
MPEGRVQRRLAAILAADVVGYSRLIEADEERTRARLGVLHYELIERRIASDGGRVVKTIGDGFLAEFSSAVDAVRNAIYFQKAMKQRNADVANDRRLDFRVGINVGDVIIEGDDIHGDGVNIAARLEGLCEPGEVYVAGAVYEQVAGKLAASFEDKGEHIVKNIAKPVRVYRAIDETRISAKPTHGVAAISAPISDKPSIAVLPFDNLSDDPQQEYFSDGMAEDLITDISKMSGVAVTARNSSFAFKGQSVDVKEIAKQLGVGHIVEGSVRKMGDRLRINAQLIDCADGHHVWAERYDGNMSEIFDFQDDIREQIVSALQVSLTPTDKALADRKVTENTEAYDLFLRGRANLYRFTVENVLEAKQCFESAIEIDANFADAYGFLSYCHYAGWILKFPGFDDTLDLAKKVAETGVELDSESAIAVSRLAWVQGWMGQFDDAISNYEKAIALAPNRADVHADFGQILNYWGDPRRALELSEEAFNLDTFTPPLWGFYAGHSHFLLRQYDEARPKISQMLERVPKFVTGFAYLACLNVETDRLEDAKKAIENLLKLAPNYTLKDMAKRHPYKSKDVSDRFLNDLRQAGLPEG